MGLCEDLHDQQYMSCESDVCRKLSCMLLNYTVCEQRRVEGDWKIILSFTVRLDCLLEPYYLESSPRHRGFINIGSSVPMSSYTVSIYLTWKLLTKWDGVESSSSSSYTSKWLVNAPQRPDNVTVTTSGPFIW